MKKEIFKQFLTNELSLKENLLANNTLSEDDKTLIQTQIDSLNSLMEQLDEVEDEKTSDEAIDALKDLVNSMDESIKAIQEKINQDIKTDTDMIENEVKYLESKNSVKDFAAIVRNAESRKNFQTEWNKKLAENGVSFEEGTEEGFLPTAVKSEIYSVWDTNADWLKDLTQVNAKRFMIRTNVSEQDAETSRAKGWKKSNAKKAEQALTLSSKEVVCQFIYKIQSVSVVDEFNDDGSLISYLVKELVDQIIYETKRAILVGDGREANSEYKITSFEALNAVGQTKTIEGESATMDEWISAMEMLKNENNKPVYAFMTKTELNSLRRYVGAEGASAMYLPVDQIADMIGVAKIITTDLVTVGQLLIPSDYVMIGENVFNPSMFTWKDGWTNTENFRFEVAAGGALKMATSAVTLATA